MTVQEARARLWWLRLKFEHKDLHKIEVRELFTVIEALMAWHEYPAEAVNIVPSEMLAQIIQGLPPAGEHI